MNSSQKPVNPRTIAILLVIGGLLFLIGSVLNLYSHYQLSRDGGTVSGIVIRRNILRKGGGEDIVSYQVGGGAYQYSFFEKIGFSRYQVGDSVPIIYNRLNPVSAAENSFEDIWEHPLLYAFLSLMAFLSGCIFLYKNKPISTSVQSTS